MVKVKEDVAVAQREYKESYKNIKRLRACSGTALITLANNDEAFVNVLANNMQKTASLKLL